MTWLCAVIEEKWTTSAFSQVVIPLTFVRFAFSGILTGLCPKKVHEEAAILSSNPKPEMTRLHALWRLADRDIAERTTVASRMRPAADGVATTSITPSPSRQTTGISRSGCERARGMLLPA